VGPTPTDPVEFRECARDARTWSAAKKHTNKEQGGGRKPGVKRPGAGRGQLPARSKICRAAMLCLILLCARFLCGRELLFWRSESCKIGSEQPESIHFHFMRLLATYLIQSLHGICLKPAQHAPNMRPTSTQQVTHASHSRFHGESREEKSL